MKKGISIPHSEIQDPGCLVPSTRVHELAVGVEPHSIPSNTYTCTHTHTHDGEPRERRHRELWSERDKEDEEGENRMALCAYSVCAACTKRSMRRCMKLST